MNTLDLTRRVVSGEMNFDFQTTNAKDGDSQKINETVYEQKKQNAPSIEKAPETKKKKKESDRKKTQDAEKGATRANVARQIEKSAKNLNKKQKKVFKAKIANNETLTQAFSQTNVNKNGMTQVAKNLDRRTKDSLEDILSTSLDVKKKTVKNVMKAEEKTEKKATTLDFLKNVKELDQASKESTKSLEKENKEANKKNDKKKAKKKVVVFTKQDKLALEQRYGIKFDSLQDAYAFKKTMDKKQKATKAPEKDRKQQRAAQRDNARNDFLLQQKLRQNGGNSK